MNKGLEISKESLIFNNKKVLTEGDVISLPLGTLVPSTVVQAQSAGLILADGSTFSQTGTLSEFANWLKSKYPNGDYSNEEYERDLSELGGQCGHYVIDDENGTIRFPRITEFVASSNAGKLLGSAELDKFKSHNHGVNDPKHTHIQQIPDKYSSSAYCLNHWKRSPNGSSGGAHLDAGYSTSLGGENVVTVESKTNITINSMGDSETKPKNIRYPYYIVVASSLESDIKIDINKYMSDLSTISSGLESLTRNVKNEESSSFYTKDYYWRADYLSSSSAVSPIIEYNFDLDTFDYRFEINLYQGSGSGGLSLGLGDGSRGKWQTRWGSLRLSASTTYSNSASPSGWSVSEERDAPIYLLDIIENGKIAKVVVELSKINVKNYYSWHSNASAMGVGQQHTWVNDGMFYNDSITNINRLYLISGAQAGALWELTIYKKRKGL